MIVFLHPATDLWAQGVHTGTLVKVQGGRVQVHVAGKRRWFRAIDVLPDTTSRTDKETAEFWQAFEALKRVQKTISGWVDKRRRK